MKKGALLEYIRRTAVRNGVGNTDDAKRISLRQIEIGVSHLWADVIMMLIKNESDLDFFTKSYYDIDIDYDLNTNEYTSLLPISVIQLPNNNGIVLIKGKGSNRKFFKSSNTSIDIHTDSDVAKYYDRILYVTEGNNKVRYVSFDYGSHNIRKVNMKLIPDFMEYGFDDEVSLPSGRITDFVNLVAKSLFQQKKQLDGNNDSNPL